MQKPPRIWVSNATPAKHEVLRVRAQMEHTMESGLRQDAEGKLRPRNIVTRFEARLGNTLLFSWEPGISVSQNPYIEFTFLARESGVLHLHWKDDTGQMLSTQKTITVG
ncbi:thiosulfate oxidation carrier complex protein SoxZ [Simplicispira psychrophila]|uniref:thiosulfate oxidation carrier complex protein SoxZ n=1 Tax=Simplicispira psychrophila TaxID=80882 RepID=UPI0004825105|nr:thiosulfate oxidation carrier complex protein SoxZ [Simplicispira psychrophila]